MSKHSVFCLGACVLAAVLLVLAFGASSAEGRYFRVVEGELVEFDPLQEPHSNHFVRTMSGDLIEIDPEASRGEEGSLEAIAEAVGWDQLAILIEGTVLAGEGSDVTEVHTRQGGNLSQMDGEFYRVVDGALIVPDSLIPHTGFFMLTSVYIWVEIDIERDLDFFRSIREQYDEIEALIASGAPIIPPPPTAEELLARERVIIFRIVDGDLEITDGFLPSFGDHFYRVVDGKLVAQEALWPNSGVFGRTQSGLLVELDSSATARLLSEEQLEEIEALIASGAPIIGPDGENQNGPVAVETTTWGGVKAAFLR